MEEEASWKPFKVSKCGPEVSHLCFAYDMSLFAKANEIQLESVMQ
jgi:hypothetical protein